VNVKVRFVGFPDLKRFLGGKEIALRFEGGMFGDLLRHLEQSYGEPLRKALLNDHGLVDDAVQVIRNDITQLAREDLSAPLKEGDVVTFLFMMPGG
jgi:molybdopterin converting factor small subunit